VLEIDATTLNASTANGAVAIEDTAGGLAVGLVTAGTADVNLRATGGSLTEAAGKARFPGATRLLRAGR
jgi:hypothetical protein